MRILLIDDDPNLCRVISYQLEKSNFTVTVANDGESGLAQFAEKEYDLVLTDIQMPKKSGIQVLQEIRRKNTDVVVIIITAYGTVENALEACRTGADDYITKPFGQEQLLFVMEKALRLRKLQRENRELHQELSRKFQFENMVTHSHAMDHVIQMARKVSRSDATVLLLGESGTGKELLARAIHHNSTRQDQRFVVVNCPSIPENLLESELFGHVKGAFTGAIKDRKGKFELADRGTLFLDEIGDLKGEVQAKLLRVLQEKEFERLGDSNTVQVDARLIAATNKNLEKLIEQGQFREDLYYRLSVVPITIPPLRERREEIPYLVDFFIRKFKKGAPITVEPEILGLLENYHWPGNIRELENVIERALILSTGDVISSENIPSHIRDGQRSRPDLSLSLPDQDLSLRNIERRAIEQALRLTGGNQSRAARLLKIPRHVLLYRLKKFNIVSANQK